MACNGWTERTETKAVDGYEDGYLERWRNRRGSGRIGSIWWELYEMVILDDGVNGVTWLVHACWR